MQDNDHFENDSFSSLLLFCIGVRVLGKCQSSITRFYKKLGSGHSSKGFLISNEILTILVLKVS